MLPPVQVEGYLTEGTLVEDYVLDSVSKLMGCIRDCNSTLRWVMLHTAPGTYSTVIMSYTVLLCFV